MKASMSWSWPPRTSVAYVFLLFLLITVFTALPALAAQPTTFGSASGVPCPSGTGPGGTPGPGSVICNGSINFMTTELFFEPETPAFSLKKGNVTWNELEQLLDNPYIVTTGTPCNDASGPLPVNFTGYPAYCTDVTKFIRRPTFAVTPGGTPPPLPPLDVFGLNYNPATGAEMRMLNPSYAGTTGFVNSGVVNGQRTGVCYTLGTDCTPAASTINVTSGASRGLAPGDHEINYTTAVGRKLPFCQTNPEPVPLGGKDGATGFPFGGPFGTFFNSQSLTACGSDPGEPGAASLANPLFTNLLDCGNEVLGLSVGFLCEDNVGLPVAGASTSTWYSVPAVRAPDVATGRLMQIPMERFLASLRAPLYPLRR